MGSEWERLYAERWCWADRAMEQVRAATGTKPASGLVKVARVMVLGDSQVGKTTLLLRLLGVREDSDEADCVLRGGQTLGRPATAVPIRYQWSPDADRWLLSDGGRTLFLTAKETEEKLAGYRGQRSSAWRRQAVGQPLRIGIPTRLGDDSRREDLRIFDLPGLYAEDPQEREVAQVLASSYAPHMNLVIFVGLVHNPAEALGDSTITGSPHLSTWRTDHERYRIVLTKAFSDPNVQERVKDRLGDEEGVAAAAREYLYDELRQSLGGDNFEGIVFPVELGKSWSELKEGKPEIAAGVEAANRRMIAELAEAVDSHAREDTQRLVAVEFTFRIVAALSDQAADRELDLKNRRKYAARCSDDEKTALGQLEKLRAEREERQQRLTAVDEARQAVRTLRVDYQRPPRPVMKGSIVRACQQKECGAWYRAATARWEALTENLEIAGEPPRDLESGLYKRYRDLVACCGKCSGSAFKRAVWEVRGEPTACYQRMTTAEEGMQEDIRNRFEEALKAPLKKAASDFSAAEQRVAQAERVCRQYAALAKSASQRYGEAKVKARRDSAEDARRKKAADSVLSLHDEENRKYVEELMSSGDGDTRYWKGVAALLALQNLGRIFKH